MLIVTGSVIARDGAFDALLEASQAHVGRSRTEPGCISHAVYRDTGNPLRLFFFERWESRAHLDAHFQTAGTATFLAATRDLVAGKPDLDIYAVAEG